MVAVDKAKVRANTCDVALPFDPKVPFLVAYEYMITYINSFVTV